MAWAQVRVQLGQISNHTLHWNMVMEVAEKRMCVVHAADNETSVVSVVMYYIRTKYM